MSLYVADIAAYKTLDVCKRSFGCVAGLQRTGVFPIKMGYFAVMQPLVTEQQPRVRRSAAHRPQRTRVVGSWISHTVIWDAALYLCPWLARGFPGRRASFLGILPRAYTWQAVQHWQKGRRRCPANVARSIAAAVRDKAERGLQLAAEHDAYADAEEARPKRRCGFLRVEEDGNFRR